MIRGAGGFEWPILLVSPKCRPVSFGRLPCMGVAWQNCPREDRDTEGDEGWPGVVCARYLYQRSKEISSTCHRRRYVGVGATGEGGSASTTRLRPVAVRGQRAAHTFLTDTAGKPVVTPSSPGIRAAGRVGSIHTSRALRQCRPRRVFCGLRKVYRSPNSSPSTPSILHKKTPRQHKKQRLFRFFLKSSPRKRASLSDMRWTESCQRKQTTPEPAWQYTGVQFPCATSRRMGKMTCLAAVENTTKAVSTEKRRNPRVPPGGPLSVRLGRTAADPGPTIPQYTTTV